MNLAIYPKGQTKIVFFLYNAEKIKDGDYRGNGGTITGVKSSVWDFFWTNDTCNIVLKDGEKIGYDKQVSDLSPVPTYNNIPVGSPEEVDVITKSKISQQYPIQDEIKILRRKFNNTLPSSDWDAYVNYCETTVQQGKKVKVLL